jgi:hypothetical protein
MQTTLDAAVDRYLRAKALSRGTRNEYRSTLRKWEQWGGGAPIEALQRKDVRAFLDWVYERAVADQGTNPGRTVNKAREHLRAVLSWAWEQELIDAPPRFPRPRPQRDVAGRHHLTKAKLNALYFATYYDTHVPESSVEILGHSVGGITYRHYAHRAPLAFRAIMTLPQPTAFAALARGFDGECPCCRRRFADAA